MNKRLCTILLILTVCFNSMAQNRNWFPGQIPWDRCWLGMTGSYSYDTGADMGESLPLAIGFDWMIDGFFFGYGNNLVHSQEKQYGAGNSISRSHNMQTYSIGYGTTIYRRNSWSLDLFPYINIIQVNDMMEDRYYDADKIVAKHFNTGMGIGLCARNKTCGGFMKLGSRNIDVGICIVVATHNLSRGNENERLQLKRQR